MFGLVLRQMSFLNNSTKNCISNCILTMFAATELFAANGESFESNSNLGLICVPMFIPLMIYMKWVFQLEEIRQGPDFRHVFVQFYQNNETKKSLNYFYL